MKKILILINLALLCTTAFAQGSNGQPQRGGGRSATIVKSNKKHSFFVGVKGGVDFTTMTQPEECDLADGAGFGYSGGVAGRVRFNQASSTAPAGTGLFGAGLELKYKLNKAKTIGTDEDGKTKADLSVSYFEAPIFVQVYPFFRSDAMNTFYIEAGPVIAGTLSRSPKTLTVDGLTGNYNAVTYHLDDNDSKLKGMDVRAMVGLGYDYAIKNDKNETKSLIGINARYYLGMSKLAGNFDSKMNTLEVSVSWMFNIGNL